jgi:hypothetical protein
LVKTSTSIIVAAATLAISIMLVGCDTESSTENKLRITPARIELRRGESQEFIASGGYDYTWSLEGGGTIDEWGWLSDAYGDRTSYTSTKNSGSSQTLRSVRVTSTISGSGTTSTTTGTNGTPSGGTGYSKSAESFVVHLTIGLTIDPLQATLGQFQSVTFTASGGGDEYVWTVATPSYGNLSASNGETTVYTSIINAGTNGVLQTLMVTSDGQTAQANIVQRN